MDKQKLAKANKAIGWTFIALGTAFMTLGLLGMWFKTGFASFLFFLVFCLGIFMLGVALWGIAETLQEHERALENEEKKSNITDD